MAYEGMERFFPAEKIMITGNPVRQTLTESTVTREKALRRLGMDSEKKTILIVGGSLGTRTINESVMKHLDRIKKSEVQIIWQTGKFYYANIQERMKSETISNLKVTDFITDMSAAYKAADLVISRAGASSISELCLTGKAAILVPSPNVAEDHQTKNAMAMTKKNAAMLVKDEEAEEKLMPTAIKTVSDEGMLRSLSENARKMALPNAAETIAREIIKLSEK